MSDITRNEVFLTARDVTLTISSFNRAESYLLAIEARGARSQLHISGEDWEKFLALASNVHTLETIEGEIHDEGSTEFSVKVSPLAVRFRTEDGLEHAASWIVLGRVAKVGGETTFVTARWDNDHWTPIAGHNNGRGHELPECFALSRESVAALDKLRATPTGTVVR